MAKKQVVKKPRVKRSTYEKQVIKEINQLNYNIRRRLVNVEKHEVTSQYYKIKNKFIKLDKSVANKNIDQLEKLRNKLRYVNSLKSTSVKGMKKAKKAEEKADEIFEEIQRKAKIMPTDNAYKDTKEIRNMINDIYNRLLEEGAWWEKGYSSQVRQDIQDLLLDFNLAPEYIFSYIRHKLNVLYENGDDYVSIYEDPIGLDYISVPFDYDIYN